MTGSRTTRRPMLTHLVVAVAATLTAAGCGGTTSDAEAEGAGSSTLQGAVLVSYGTESEVRRTYTITGRDIDDVLDTPCDGSTIADGFSDMREGAEVTVTDASGDTVALGRLKQGVRSGASTCEMPFTVTDVPHSEFYAVEVAGRGEQRFTRAELDAASWDIDLTLRTG